jgi:hypothetical protein
VLIVAWITKIDKNCRNDQFPLSINVTETYHAGFKQIRKHQINNMQHISKLSFFDKKKIYIYILECFYMVFDINGIKLL